MKLFVSSGKNIECMDVMVDEPFVKEGETLFEFKVKGAEVLRLDSRGIVASLMKKANVQADANFIERVIHGEFTAVKTLVNRIDSLIDEKTVLKTGAGYCVLKPQKLKLVSMQK